MRAQSLVVLVMAIGGCTPNPSSQQTANAQREHGKLKIVTTCPMVTDLVCNVAGDRADIGSLIKTGVNPHLFKPSHEHVHRIESADIIFCVGLMLEGRVTDKFTRATRRGIPVYAVTEAIDKSYLREPSEFGGHWDPHVWMDVNAWTECVDVVAEGLSKRDPKNSGYYANNAAVYKVKLAELDVYIRKAISSIPEDQRLLVTSDHSFGYFSRHYEIPIRVTARNSEETTDGLFTHWMGEPDTYEGTYIGMMDHNATSIAEALGGQVPKGGMNGKLSRD